MSDEPPSTCFYVMYFVSYRVAFGFGCHWSGHGTFAERTYYLVFVLCNRLNRRRVKHRLEFDSGGRKWIDLGEEQVRLQRRMVAWA